MILNFILILVDSFTYKKQIKFLTNKTENFNKEMNLSDFSIEEIIDENSSLKNLKRIRKRIDISRSGKSY